MDNEQIKGADLFVQQLQGLKQYLENNIETVISVEAVNHFKDSFTQQGFTDESLKKWAPRKSKRVGGTNNQPVLSKTGELADSIEASIRGNTIVIISDKPYAQIHNEGGRITVTPKMQSYFWSQYYRAKESGSTDLMDQYKAMALAKFITIEKRQFIGDSVALQNRIADKILADLQAIFLK